MLNKKKQKAKQVMKQKMRNESKTKQVQLIESEVNSQDGNAEDYENGIIRENSDSPRININILLGKSEELSQYSLKHNIIQNDVNNMMKIDLIQKQSESFGPHLPYLEESYQKDADSDLCDTPAQSIYR